jgi:amidohydrolase
MMDIINYSKGIQREIVNWRRELHKMPEIGFSLEKTSEFIIERLKEMNIEYRLTAETGIVAIIRGEAKGRTVALRADMDALPIKEETDLPYASSNGSMHACGHDAHVAMLLGAAKILSENKKALSGNVKLLFQPAEENFGGAQIMISEGCLENPKVDVIFGLHIGSLSREVGNGMIGIRKGAMMAAVDRFIIRIIGKGGHGAAPHECVDPITVACEVVASLQKIVSREINPVNPAVLTIGQITGGTAFNIIPKEVVLEGTVRTLNNEDRTYIENRITEIVKFITKANKAEYIIDYENSYPVLMNNDLATDKLSTAAAKIIGKDKIVELKNPVMGAEDMAYYLQEVPGTFFYLGSNNENKGIVYPHHNSQFNIDEDVLWIGTAVFLQAVIDYLA